MRQIKPKAGPVDYAGLSLTPEEGFVLSRVDAPTTTQELVSLTGLTEERVDEIVDKLARVGALDAEGLSPPPTERLEPEPMTERQPSRSTPERTRRTSEPGEDAGAIPPEELLDEGGPEEPEDVEQGEDLNYRKLYETRLRHMDRDARLALARTATGAELLALCLDQDPQVIQMVLENPVASLDHCRYIALWHRTPSGLEAVAKDPFALRDRQIERRLLRNPQLPDGLLARILAGRRLLEVWKACVDRDILERTRQKARVTLKSRWTTAQPEERAELLLTTEARVLMFLVGCTIDARTVQILCGRTQLTTMFVASVARFSAAPPPLLAHLAKMPLVRRNIQLRRMLLSHRNMPSEAKKNL